MRVKRVLMGVVATFALLAAVLMLPVTALADSFGMLDYSSKITVSKSEMPYIVEMGKKAKGATKVTVKSSKKSVVAAAVEQAWYSDGTEVSLPIITAKKAGVAHVTIKVTKGGKTKTYKMKVTVIKYKNPLKKLKLGNATLTKKFKKSTYYSLNITAKQKLTVKAASGWKVKSIRYSYYNPAKNAFVSKKIKSGGYVPYRKDGLNVTIELLNKKRNQKEVIGLAINPNY